MATVARSASHQVKSQARAMAAPSAFRSHSVQLSSRAAILGGSRALIARSPRTHIASGSKFSVRASIPPPADVAGPPPEAEVTASGLASVVLQVGDGDESPAAVDEVTVHYTGWTTDGKMFDSSVARGETISFPLNRVIKGWTEGLQLMVVGEKRRFWIPADLAYGSGGMGRPSGMLVFEVELFSFKSKPKPPPAPADVGAIPDDAEVTPSGLASRMLKAGTGTTNPGPTSQVEVDYSGWTLDGTLFDSSIPREETITFPLNGVIAGWTEGLQMMVEGESRRFWIPADLAYGNNPPPGAPAGMLVFDVVLHKIF